MKNKPIILEMKPGKYFWCACGRTQNEPFCDGSHEQTNLRPIIVEIEEQKKVAWCGCKVSENKPYCDGSHKKYSE